MQSKETFRRAIWIIAGITAAALGVAALIAVASGGFVKMATGTRGGAAVDQVEALALEGVTAITIDGVSEDVAVSRAAGVPSARLHGTVGARRDVDLPRLEVTRTGDAVAVRVVRPGVLGTWWNDLVLEVTLPPAWAGKLDLSTVSGDVRIDGTGPALESIEVGTTSGDIALGQASAKAISLHTTSGGIRATGSAAATASVRSTSGDVLLSGFTGNATVHTVSGDVSAAWAAAPKTVEVSTTSGDVALRLPEGAGFVLEARSTSGDVTCGLPITVSGSSSGGAKHVLAGTVGSGDGAVRVRTVSGEIEVQK